MERVQQCRFSGSEPERNNCIIGALRGRASSDQELRTLATTYQAAGRTADALRTMRQYVQRYPQGPMATSFQQYIQRNGN